LGYDQVFIQKPLNRLDGCLVGVKNSRFKILECEELHMNSGHEYEGHPDFIRENIAVFVKVEDIHNPGTILNVICTHLYWDPKFEHVKYFQASLLLKLLEKKVKEDDNFIICGDLNVLPDSNLIRLFLTKEKPDSKYFEKHHDDALEHMNKIHTNLQPTLEKFEFDNAYRHYGQTIEDEEITYPHFTNYTHEYQGTLDHILYSKKNFEVKALLRLPKAEHISDRSLPTEDYPSDHLMIAAILEAKPTYTYVNDN